MATCILASMAAYFVAQAYDAQASIIWQVLTDFPSWPQWFPNISRIDVEGAQSVARGTRLLATGEDRSTWTRWLIVEYAEPTLLVCEHVDSHAAMAGQVQSAYLQFELIDDSQGCTLEVEIGAEGYGVMGDFIVGVTLGSNVRRVLPRLVDAFTGHLLATLGTRP